MATGCILRRFGIGVSLGRSIGYNASMFPNHTNLKRHSIAILIFALLALPYHTVRGCCCDNPTAQSTCACDGCCCQASHQQSSSSDGCSDPSCESCRKDCKCQKQIEQNKVVRKVEHPSTVAPIAGWSHTIDLQPICILAVSITTLDAAWLNSTYNQRRASLSVWLK